MKLNINNEFDMKEFGQTIGALLSGGEIIELIGDVGAGKTTFVKGLAVGLGIDENIQSPSFTINRVYEGRDDLILSHYDFYRLGDVGIMANELAEVISKENIVTVIEWAELVSDILPVDRLSIKITSPTEDSRQLVIDSGGEKSDKIKEKLVL